MDAGCLERYRPLLRVQVRQLQLSPAWRRRFDSSDLIQETLLYAHRELGQFRGGSEGELLAWLRVILERVVIDRVRHETAQKRDLRLERSLQALLADSSARLDALLADPAPRPDLGLERHEQLLRVAAAVERLPDDQRDVLILRDLEGLPVAEIAGSLGRTEKSVAGLLLRGRRAVRQSLDAPPGGPDHGQSHRR